MTQIKQMLINCNQMLINCHFIIIIFKFSTAICLPLTPGYVASISSFPVPRGLAGQIFCRVLGSRYALFTMGKDSILKVTCLAIEGWYCVFRQSGTKTSLHPSEALTVRHRHLGLHVPFANKQVF